MSSKYDFNALGGDSDDETQNKPAKKNKRRRKKKNKGGQPQQQQQQQKQQQKPKKQQQKQQPKQHSAPKPAHNGKAQSQAQFIDSMIAQGFSREQVCAGMDALFEKGQKMNDRDILLAHLKAQGNGAPEPAAPAAPSASGPQSQQHETLEKVASMDDLEQVLLALTEYFRRIPTAIPQFFDSSALLKLLMNLLSKLPQATLDGKMETFFAVLLKMPECIGAPRPKRGEMLPPPQAIVRNLRNIFELLGDWSGESPPLKEMAVCLTDSIARNRNVNRSEGSLSEQLSVLDGALSNSSTTVAAAAVASKKSYSAKTMFEYRDAQHDFISALKTKCTLLSGMTEPVVVSADGSAPSTHAVYELLKQSVANFDPSKEKEMMAVRKRLESLRSQHMAQIEPLLGKEKRLAQEMQDLEQKKIDLNKQLVECDRHIEGAKSKLANAIAEKKEVDKTFDKKINKLNEGHVELVSAVKTAMDRKEAEKLLQKVGGDLETFTKKASASFDNKFEGVLATTRVEFFKTARDYLISEKPCIEFLKERVKLSNLKMKKQQDELQSLKEMGMQHVVAGATAQIASMKQMMQEDSNCVLALTQDARVVFEVVKAQMDGPTAEECKLLHGLVAPFRALGIGEDWTPPGQAGPSKPVESAPGFEPFMMEKMLSESVGSVGAVRTANNAAKQSSVVKPQAKAKPAPQRQPRARAPRGGAPAPKLKMSWASKPAAPKSHQSLKEIQAAQRAGAQQAEAEESEEDEEKE